MPKSFLAICALFGALLIAGGIEWAHTWLQSDPDALMGELFLGGGVIFLVGVFGFFWSLATCRSRPVFMKAMLLQVVCIALGYAAFKITMRCLVPPNIDFEYSYPGNTGSFHMVQFYFKVNGKWLEGPSVEAWPMTLSFPDLNGDGYPDIRVTENIEGGVVEFVYLPTIMTRSSGTW